MVQRSAKQLFWTDRLLKKAEEWGKKGNSAIMRGQIKFLNKHGVNFDWDNDDLEEIKLSKTDEKSCNLTLLLRSLVLQFSKTMIRSSGPSHMRGRKKKIPSVAQLMAEASENSGRNLETNTQVNARGVDIEDLRG